MTPKMQKQQNKFWGEKNANIETLRKQLKLLSIEDTQAKGVGELEKEKENMFKIIIEQGSQIKDMEVEMEKLLQEKEWLSHLAIVPLTTVPISLSTTAWASTSIAAPAQNIDSPNELVKAMEDMSI